MENPPGKRWLPAVRQHLRLITGFWNSTRHQGNHAAAKVTAGRNTLHSDADCCCVLHTREMHRSQQKRAQIYRLPTPTVCNSPNSIPLSLAPKKTSIAARGGAPSSSARSDSRMAPSDPSPQGPACFRTRQSRALSPRGPGTEVLLLLFLRCRLYVGRVHSA